MTTANEPSPNLQCHDWMMIGGTNHYARDRSAFTIYKPVQGPPVEVGGLKVVGVGRVELQGPRSPNDPRTNTLVLENVLHEPNAICNGISMWILNVAWNAFTEQVYDTVTREPVWYGQRYCRLWRLVLAGQSELRGVSNLRDGALYMLSVYASPGELDELARRLEK